MQEKSCKTEKNAEKNQVDETMGEEIIEKTLVLVKPDGVKRGLIGNVISRFESIGFKIVAMKMVLSGQEKSGRHYGEDIAKRRGEHVRKNLIDFLNKGPIVAMVVEGPHAIEIIRKVVGSTDPKEAAPGTIRGDFSYFSLNYADLKGKAAFNVIHASSKKEDAEHEISIWFSPEEIYDYKTLHDLLIEEL